MFTEKKPDDEQKVSEAEEDDFQTDDEDVSEMEVDNQMQKRKKVSDWITLAAITEVTRQQLLFNH